MSTISLVKNQKVDITKTNPGMKVAVIGAGWDVAAQAATTGQFDLDLFAFVYKNGKFSKQLEDVVFYNNNKPVTGVALSEDNRTGAGDGDDETLSIDFSQLPSEVDEFVIGIDIHEAKERSQNFGMIASSYVAISADGGAPIVRYDLNEDFGTNTVVILGRLYKRDSEWKFEAKGDGMEGAIDEVAAIY